jgi:hypothetical protein
MSFMDCAPALRRRARRGSLEPVRVFPLEVLVVLLGGVLPAVAVAHAHDLVDDLKDGSLLVDALNDRELKVRSSDVRQAQQASDNAEPRT